MGDRWTRSAGFLAVGAVTGAPGDIVRKWQYAAYCIFLRLFVAAERVDPEADEEGQAGMLPVAGNGPTDKIARGTASVSGQCLFIT